MPDSMPRNKFQPFLTMSHFIHKTSGNFKCKLHTLLIVKSELFLKEITA